MSALAPLLEAFFTERLIGQREASHHTVAAYRDAFCLLLRFAQRHTGRAPHELTLEDLDAQLIGAFLNHLETERAVSVRHRNARLTAIRSLFHFAAYRHPEHAALIQRVLAIPPKRTDRALVTYLTEDEMKALLDAPDCSSWIGRRDHALLVLALETGLRVSELSGLTCTAVVLGTGPACAAHGKGRKSRRCNPTAQRDPGAPRGEAQQTRGRTFGSAISGAEGWTAEPRRYPSSRGATRRRCRCRISILYGEGCFSTRAETQLRDEPSASRSRHGHHRSLARTRGHPHNLRRLPPRRPRPQGKCPRFDPHHRVRGRADTAHPTRFSRS